MADVVEPMCRTFDAKGDSVCDQPARFIVWGHLFEKRDKGPKCERHLPPTQGAPWLGLGSPAIYEIPRPSVTAEQVLAASEELTVRGIASDAGCASGWLVRKVLSALGVEVRDTRTLQRPVAETVRPGGGERA